MSCECFFTLLRTENVPSPMEEGWGLIKDDKAIRHEGNKYIRCFAQKKYSKIDQNLTKNNKNKKIKIIL